MTEKGNVLFVDDEKHILVALRALFRQQYNVFIAQSGADALDIICQEHIHAIVSDQRMPQMQGHELLAQVKRLSPNTMRLLLTGYSDMAAIVNSINDGEIFRFIHKPWDNAEIRVIVDKVVQIAMHTREYVPPEDDTSLLDTSEIVVEYDDQAVEPAPPITPSGPGILILDDDKGIIAQVTTLYQGKRPIMTASSVEDAVQILETEDIAVIITDVQVQGEDTTDFIKLLKAQYPLILTMVLTAAFDSDTAVGLINHARIFRFLRKPIGNGLLRISINNGLHFYHIHKTNPVLLQREQATPVSTTKPLSLSQKVISRIAGLRTRLGTHTS